MSVNAAEERKDAEPIDRVASFVLVAIRCESECLEPHRQYIMARLTYALATSAFASPSRCCLFLHTSRDFVGICLGPSPKDKSKPQSCLSLHLSYTLQDILLRHDFSVPFTHQIC